MGQFKISLYHIITTIAIFGVTLYFCYSYSYELGLSQHAQIETNDAHQEGYNEGYEEAKGFVNEKCAIQINNQTEQHKNVVKKLEDYYKAREQSLHQTIAQNKLEIGQKEDLISSLRRKISPNSDSWITEKNIAMALIGGTIGKFWQIIIGWLGQLFTLALSLWEKRNEYI